MRASMSAGRPTGSRPQRPLEGVRIADLSQVWAGPKCTQILGDLGAEVIKIEGFRRLDPARGLTNLLGNERFPDADPGERPYNRSGYFNCLGRNKTSLAVDLRTPEGKAMVEDLVRISDVVVENFSAGVMERLGLGFAQLQALNPRIVMVSMSGYGGTGPDSRYRGWASSIEAAGGFAAVTGYEDEPPFSTGQALSDPAAGIFCAGAVLTGLHHARRTGAGKFLDLSQVEVLATMASERLMDAAMNGRVRPRLGDRDERYAPHNAYPSAGDDRWVTIAVETDAEWARLRELMVADGAWPQGEVLATVAERLARREEIDDRIAAWTRRAAPYEMQHRLQAAGIACGAVLNTAELIADPQIVARGLFETIGHNEIGPYDYYAPAGVRFGARDLFRARKGSPRLGEDNRDILSRVLGMTNEQVNELESKSVIADRPRTEAAE